MKRFNHIFEKIIDIENLKIAHKKASLGKKSYWQVRKVNKDLDFYLLKIQKILQDKSYKVGRYRVEIINDKGKERELFKLPYYPDRIIQWAIMLQIETILVKNFCYHTCASIKGRGIKRAFRLSKKYTKKHATDCKYCLKFDIKKFYPNIDKGILKQLLRTKFKDNDLLWLLDLIIDSYPKETGIPIGSYLSQFLANFYLSKFDHYLKENLRLKYVVRYMDDICIYSDNKAHLHSVLAQSRDYLSTHLNLKIKENYQIFPTRIRGVDFVGYRFFGDFILLRKSIALAIKRKVKVLNKAKITIPAHIHSFYSYLGFLVPANTRRFYAKYMYSLDWLYRWFLDKNYKRFKELA